MSISTNILVHCNNAANISIILFLQSEMFYEILSIKKIQFNYFSKYFYQNGRVISTRIHIWTIYHLNFTKWITIWILLRFHAPEPKRKYAFARNIKRASRHTFDLKCRQIYSHYFIHIQGIQRTIIIVDIS